MNLKLKMTWAIMWLAPIVAMSIVMDRDTLVGKREIFGTETKPLVNFWLVKEQRKKQKKRQW